MKLRRFIPTLVSGLIAITAVFLFLHTAVSRQRSAKARDLAVGSASLGAQRDRMFVEGSSAASQRPALSATERGVLMAKRLDDVRAIADSLEQTRALLALIREFGSDDFPPALEHCNRKASPGLSLEFMTILEEWSHRDPQAALAYTREDGYLESLVIGTWSQSDPLAALRWVRENPWDNFYDWRASWVLVGIAARNPELAMEHLSELSPIFQEKTVMNIAGAGEPDSANALVQWVASIKDPIEQASMIKYTFSHWHRDKTQEQRFALYEAYPEILGDASIKDLFGSWNFADPASVSAALDRLPSGDSRREGVDGVVSELLSHGDQKGAGKMLESHRDDVDDEMLSNWITDPKSKDPLEALRQTALIQDTAIHDTVLAKVLDRWADVAPDAAREWIAANEVSTRAREKFENLSKRLKDHRDANIMEAVSR